MNERKIGALSIVSVIFGCLSLLFGIISIIFSFITAGICMVFGIVSIITGIIALVKKDKIAIPIIGIVMSIISFFIAIIIVMIPIISLVTSFSSDMERDNNYDTYYSKSIINGNSKNKDEISGYSYIEKQDNSLLDLKSDGTFLYYKDKDDKTDNYYEGTYVVYQGEDAIKYIANDLETYGLTEEEQKDLIRRNEEYKEENYYCLVLKNNKCIMNGKNTLTSTIETPYYGFFFEQIDTLMIVNMKSANIYNFVR